MSEGLPLDAPREACGVFGICSQDMAVAKATFYALYALQHRGQEAAGIATTDGQRLCVHKDTGLVSQVFDEQALSTLVGTMAIGHNRYSTKGSSLASHAQPYTLETIAGPLAIAHNGNVVNAGQMRQDLLALGTRRIGAEAGDLVIWRTALPHTASLNRGDSPRVAQYITMSPAGDSEEARRKRTDFWQRRLSGLGRYAEEREAREGKTAELTSLGRKLAGVDPWE